MTEPQHFRDDLYTEPESVERQGRRPLAREVEAKTPGRAPDLGCGEGGDALWLAERGWQSSARSCWRRSTVRPRRRASASASVERGPADVDPRH